MDKAEDDIEAGVRSVDTQIHYLLPGTPINRRFVSAGVEVNTGTYAAFPMKVRDARAIKDHFTLQTHGFTLTKHQSAVRDFFDKSEVDAIYSAEVVAAVKALTGASCVAPRGWMIRTSGDRSSYKRAEGPYTHQGGVQPPAGEAHVDTHPDFADRDAKRAYEQFRPDGPGYTRYIYSSFWRTFSEPPQDCPLALCDHRSVREDEGVPNFLYVVDEIPDRQAMLAPMPDQERLAAAIFHHNSQHRWWYFSSMTRDEALLIKFHDSDRSVAWRTPHTSFWDPSFPDRKPRASIEFRTVAFFE
jgi:hypothetical protein